MFEKRWLCAVDELRKLIDVVEYLSRYASVTFSAKLEEPVFY
jgi:hypothetical protein